MVCSKRARRLTLFISHRVAGLCLARQAVVDDKGYLRLQRWSFYALGSDWVNFIRIERARSFEAAYHPWLVRLLYVRRVRLSYPSRTVRSACERGGHGARRGGFRG